MGNCQAIENNESLIVQHPSGRVEKHYLPISAANLMKTNPGHCVALLLTTTTTAISATADDKNKNNNVLPSVRVTRIKLLKPTDTLLLGHVYRLITTQEVMKGLWAKKHSKTTTTKQMDNKVHEKSNLDSYIGVVGRSEVHKNQVKVQEKHRSRNSSSAVRCKAWQPKLLTISEAGS